MPLTCMAIPRAAIDRCAEKQVQYDIRPLIFHRKPQISNDTPACKSKHLFKQLPVQNKSIGAFLEMPFAIDAVNDSDDESYSSYQDSI